MAVDTIMVNSVIREIYGKMQIVSGKNYIITGELVDYISISYDKFLVWQIVENKIGNPREYLPIDNYLYYSVGMQCFSNKDILHYYSNLCQDIKGIMKLIVTKKQNGIKYGFSMKDLVFGCNNMMRAIYDNLLNINATNKCLVEETGRSYEVLLPMYSDVNKNDDSQNVTQDTKNIDIDVQFKNIIMAAEIMKELISNMEPFIIGIGTSQEIQVDNSAQTKSEMKISPNSKILQELIDAGQVRKEKNNFFLNDKPPKFIDWCIDKGYISDKKDDIDEVTPQFIFSTLNPECNLETLKKYFRVAKEPKQTPRQK
jgi:hypothetical protein